ncbi:MAG: FMN-binding glutamate synthase family protein [Geminicoccaceae bacterium]
MFEMLPGFVLTSLNFLATLLVFAIGCVIFLIAVLYVIDRTQTTNTVRRNYPVIGRLRSFFEHMGEFFRQYFFAMDREELPFNRAQRSWAYRAAKGVDNTVAFGSTRDLRPVGTPLFVACPFPTLDEDAVDPPAMTIGANCAKPYVHDHIFNISGMSYGALSRVAVKSLSRGAKLAGCWYNTGEGAMSEFHLEGGCDIIFQIGTAKYGCRTEDGAFSEEKLGEIAAHPEVKMFEIKLSQGAKPGKGGILPGNKVTPEIARTRGIPIGKDSISPNRHIEIDNPGELLDFIARVRRATNKPVGFKTVISGVGWLGKLFDEIHRRGVESAPDFITVDSADGGTGAAPQSLIDNMGLPIWESLPMVADQLIRYDLKDRVKLIASGKLVTPTDVAWAMCTGADFVVSARGFMFALGCIQALKCNKNTCPTGVTTHNKDLQRGLVPKEKQYRVADYAKNMAKEVGIIAHSCGVHEPRRLKRYHVRIQTDTGKSIPMDQLWPYPEPGEALKEAAQTAAE